VLIRHEMMHDARLIYLDGRPHPPPSLQWLAGHSVGHFEGQTLVVDTRGFNGSAWLDQLGRPTTDALHVIERFTRKDFGHMQIQVTIDDRKAYTRPWTVTQEVRLLTNTELLEFTCNENNRDLEHLPTKSVR
jgi:hypothetical protein